MEPIGAIVNWDELGTDHHFVFFAFSCSLKARGESAWAPAFAGVTVWGRLAWGGMLSWYSCSMGERVPGGTGSFYPWGVRERLG